MTCSQLPAFSPDWVFFLDIDGTLADIAPTPQEAVIPQSTLHNLCRLQSKASVTLVSGRSLASIDAMTFPLRFAAAGQHGLEIRYTDREVFYVAGRGEPIKAIEDSVRIFQARHPKLLVEYKGLSIAIHYRKAPDLARTVQDFCDTLMQGQDDVFCLQHGKMVEEIKLRGANKGTAIEYFMQQPNFRNKIPVFAGDDLTDEDAHIVVNRMGGITINIGCPSHAAHYCLAAPQNLRTWIHKVSELEMADL